MEPLTREQKKKLRQLALSIFLGQIWGSWQGQNATAAFLPLKGLSPEQIKQYEQDKIVHFFSPLKSAVEMSDKGYPLFMTMESINSHEWSYLQMCERDLKEIIDDFIADEEEV